MRKAFSLIELLIVILIIGIVYTLAIGNFKQLEQNGAEKVSLQNLKRYLKTFTYEKSVRLLCLDRCSNCNIYVDGELQKDLEGTLNEIVDANVKVYRYEYSLGALRESEQSFFNSEDVEEEVCFSYTIDKQGVGEQVLVEQGGFVYDLSTYFTPTPKYSSLEEAVSQKDSLVEEVLR